jgi:2'-5' RNA ligase
MWPFKKKVVVNEYTFWFGFKVETNREIRVLSDSITMIAPTQELAEKWFAKSNPHVTVNMITVMRVP